eukprot:3822457-Pyramimonas_sp.AAC.1
MYLYLGECNPRLWGIAEVHDPLYLTARLLKSNGGAGGDAAREGGEDARVEHWRSPHGGAETALRLQAAADGGGARQPRRGEGGAAGVALSIHPVALSVHTCIGSKSASSMFTNRPVRVIVTSCFRGGIPKLFSSFHRKLFS